MAILTGSEKQIAWAETIRANMLKNNTPIDDISRLKEKYKNSIEHYNTKIAEGRGGENTINYLNDAKIRFEKICTLEKEIENQTEATWFIDNRGKSILVLADIIEKKYNNFVR